MQRPNVELGYTVKTIPQGPTFPAGQLHEISAGMRTFRPVIDASKCIHCLRCFWCARMAPLTSLERC